MDENAAAWCDGPGRKPRGPNREPVGGDAGYPAVARRRATKLDLDRCRLTPFVFTCEVEVAGTRLHVEGARASQDKRPERHLAKEGTVSDLGFELLTREPAPPLAFFKRH